MLWHILERILEKLSIRLEIEKKLILFEQEDLAKNEGLEETK